MKKIFLLIFQLTQPLPSEEVFLPDETLYLYVNPKSFMMAPMKKPYMQGHQLYMKMGVFTDSTRMVNFLTVNRCKNCYMVEQGREAFYMVEQAPKTSSTKAGDYVVEYSVEFKKPE